MNAKIRRKMNLSAPAHTPAVPATVYVVSAYNTISKNSNYPVVVSRLMRRKLMTAPSKIL